MDVSQRGALQAHSRDPSRHAGYGAASLQLAVRGAGLERCPAGEPEGAGRMAGRHDLLRDLLCRDAGVRVHPLRTRRTHDQDQSVWGELLYLDRFSRHSRDLGRYLADHALDRGNPREDTAGQGAQSRDGSSVLALRRRGVDRDLPRRIPHQVRQLSMDAHSTTAAPTEHAHPTAALYFKVGLVLFVLTALEVGLYEFTYGEHVGSAASAIQPFFVPLLLLMSAAKFALVAMFYMHLKQDSKLFTGIFVFPLIIATVIIVSLMVLAAYHFAFAKT